MFNLTLSFPTVVSGLVYGKLTGMTKHTLKSDIVNLLEGCKLTEDDVKVNYTRNYMPVGMYCSAFSAFPYLEFPMHQFI